ncbi:hypothetical protein ACQB60_40630 [Actinomycetota bacterium Odt1-20B]
MRTGPPYADASRANALSAASSFFDYLDKVDDTAVVKNPFAAVARPVIDPDYSLTVDLTDEQGIALLVTARDHHRVRAYRKRAYALLLKRYTLCLRISTLLNARVEHLDYDRGHHVLTMHVKGGAWKKKPIPPHVGDAPRRRRLHRCCRCGSSETAARRRPGRNCRRPASGRCPGWSGPWPASSGC